MKKWNRIIILIFLISFVLASCEINSKWKGTIKEESGVTVIKNPKDPIFQTDIFHLEEEIAIGAKERIDGYMFSRIKSFSVDEKERIFILDNIEPHIKVFSRNGNYVNSFGEKGQGPGEMQNPQYIQITPDKELMVYDSRNRRFTFFSLMGNYKRQLSSANVTFYPNIKIDSRGNFTGITYSKKGIELKKYSPKLEQSLSISSIDEWSDDWLILPFYYFSLTKKDYIVWGYSNKYELQILSPEGKIVMKILKEHTPLRITKERREEYIDWATDGKGLQQNEKIKYQKYYLPFMNLSIDDEGRIFVGTYEKAKNKKDHFYFDVFNSSGKFIAKIPIKIGIEGKHIWKKEKLYVINEKEDGYQIVRRYKVIWKK